MTKLLHVVAAVIRDQNQHILLTKRLKESHQGGLWEFPGGKCETGETALAALKRELREELDIQLNHARPLIRIRHDYTDRAILLDIWETNDWQGKPWGKEGQQMTWCSHTQLKNYTFPAANAPIIRAAQLPSQYAISPKIDHHHPEHFWQQFRATLDKGLRLIQFRAPELTAAQYQQYAEKAMQLCAEYNAQLMLNATPTLLEKYPQAGLHLNSQRLHTYNSRPIAQNQLLAASCHTAADILQAQVLKTNFIVLSPVKKTLSHPEANPLNWHAFFQHTESAHCPVYALGGLQTRHLHSAWAHGGQGIAAIRGLWSN